MQGLSLGPADLAANRRMKTTRVGGGHPGYLVRQDPTDGDIDGPAHHLPAGPLALHDRPHGRRLRDANGIFPYYGPFGDIKDVVACEDQFRNAFLLGCVGAWSLHPVQIASPRRCSRPVGGRRARATRHRGDGRRHGRGDARREDGGRRLLKQCHVMVDLAKQLAARDEDVAERTAPWAWRSEHERPTIRPRRSVLYMPGANERALEKAKGIDADALILDLEDAVAPDAKAEARDRVCAAAASGDYGSKEVTIRVNGLDTQWHAADIAAAAPPARPRSWCPR
jgi:citrate lyase beta subunit